MIRSKPASAPAASLGDGDLHHSEDGGYDQAEDQRKQNEHRQTIEERRH